MRVLTQIFVVLQDSDYERQLLRQAEIRESVIRSKEMKRKEQALAALQSDKRECMSLL